MPIKCVSFNCKKRDWRLGIYRHCFSIFLFASVCRHRQNAANILSSPRLWLTAFQFTQNETEFCKLHTIKSDHLYCVEQTLNWNLNLCLSCVWFFHKLWLWISKIQMILVVISRQNAFNGWKFKILLIQLMQKNKPHTSIIELCAVKLANATYWELPLISFALNILIWILTHTPHRKNIAWMESYCCWWPKEKRIFVVVWILFANVCGRRKHRESAKCTRRKP